MIIPVKIHDAKTCYSQPIYRLYKSTKHGEGIQNEPNQVVRS